MLNDPLRAPHAAVRVARRSWLFLTLLIGAGTISCGSDASGPEARIASAIKLSSGDKQTGIAGSTLPNPISLAVLNTAGDPVFGAIVSFAVTAGGGAVGATLDTSDVAGRVSTVWTVGTKAGDSQTLTVTVLSATRANASAIPPVVLAATAIAGPAVALEATPTTVSGRVGEPLTPIAVTMRDQYGNRASGTDALVTARLVDANRSLLNNNGNASVKSTENGATFTGLLVTGGSGLLTLLVESSGLTPARVTLALNGGTPVRMEAAGGVSVEAVALTAGPPISVRILDAWENPVAGIDAVFSIDGGGVIGHASSGSDGIASLAAWTAPALGSYRLTVSIDGVSSPIQFALVTRAGLPTTLTPLSTNPFASTAGFDVVLSVRATDAAGNIVPNTPLDWTNIGVVSGQVFTDNKGVAVFAAQLARKAGPNQIVIHSGESASLTINVAGVAGPLYNIKEVSTSVDAPAGGNVDVGFTAVDIWGNPVSGATVYPRLNARYGGAAISQTKAVTNASGVAYFTLTTNPYAGDQDVGAGADAGTYWYALTTVYGTASRGTLRILSGTCSYPANSYLLTPITALVYGSNGRFATGVPVTFTVQSGGGTITKVSGGSAAQTVIVPSSGGDASVEWTVSTAPGTYSVSVTSSPGYDALSPASYSCRRF